LVPENPTKKTTEEKTDEIDISVEFFKSIITENETRCESLETSSGPHKINLKNIITRGTKACGYRNIAKVTQESNHDSFIEESEFQLGENTSSNTAQTSFENDKICTSDLVELLFQRVERVVHKNRPQQARSNIDITANGSVESIVK
jgi:hypothetical protein